MQPSGSGSTEQLFHRVKAHDKDALTTFYRKFDPLLRRGGQRFMSPLVGVEMEIDDLVAETWKRFIVGLDGIKFYSSRQLRALLLLSVRHVAAEAARRGKRKSSKVAPRNNPGGRPEDVVDENRRGASSVAEFAETKGIVAKVLPRIPQHYRRILFEHFIVEMNLNEIAEAHGQKPDTVRKQIKRACDHVAKFLRTEGFQIE